ncbi:MAG TPA: CDP-alcohol phosphatidyltransferase family protein [Candidatus Jeotgalibaca pullicola]|nr:CDP-alcohol phosphatidyltransferase family protein [Candidatus Jeotgalibaca pullicola]
MFQFIPVFHISNSLSFIGLFFSILSIYTIMTGNISRAIMLMVVSVICDLFDGKFANQFERTLEEKQMGEYVDSFVDMISFIALPIVLLLSITEYSIFALFISIFYAVMGIHRLGYFHITKEEQLDSEGNYFYFIGVPVAYISLIIPIIYTVCILFQATHTLFFQVLLQMIYIIMALMFVWNHPIPKPRGKMYVFFVLLALLVLFILGSR